MGKKIKAILAVTLTVLGCSLLLPEKVSAADIHVTSESFGKHPEKIHTLLLGYEVTKIDDGAFSGLVNLEEIKVDGKNPYYASSEGCLYNKNFTVLICVPQNTTTIPVRTSIVSRTEHALDGLSQERIDNIDAYLAEKKGVKTTEKSFSDTEYAPQEKDEKAETADAIGGMENVGSMDSQPDASYAAIEEMEEVKPPHTDTDFSQYVYTDEDGRQTFRYTGTGESTIVVPEGEEVILGFTGDIETLNYDITYVYLPKTLRMMWSLDMFNQAEFGYDTERYNALYSCPNLMTVEGGNYSYRANGNSVIRPGDIMVWSNSSKIPFDLQKYYDVNAKLGL